MVGVAPRDQPQRAEAGEEKKSTRQLAAKNRFQKYKAQNSFKKSKIFCKKKRFFLIRKKGFFLYLWYIFFKKISTCVLIVPP